MKKKYQKHNEKIVDLHERQNIKIIKACGRTISDDEMEAFEQQLQVRSKSAEDFYEYCINEQIKQENAISDSDFNLLMKNLLKEHKLLKSMIKGQD